MKYLRKFIKLLPYILLNAILILLIMTHLLEHSMQYSNDDIQEFFDQYEIPHTIEYIHTSAGSVRTVMAKGEQQKNLIIAIHGAPGGWDVYKDYMIKPEILAKADIIAYDRPGYGHSGNGNPVPSLDLQAKVISEIINKQHYASYTLLSHSFGGPIGVKACLDNPDKIKTHLMLSPAISPKAEKFFWFTPFSYWKATKWLLPDGLIIAGSEKYHHVEELSKLQNEIPYLRTSTVLMHGENDILAPAQGNINYVKEVFPSDMINIRKLPDEGHLFIWTTPELVIKELLSWL